MDHPFFLAAAALFFLGVTLLLFRYQKKSAENSSSHKTFTPPPKITRRPRKTKKSKPKKEVTTALEVGTLYERYIGYLYEREDFEVEYNGALHGVSDLGRDLIVHASDEIMIVQTKCWAKYKHIHESHIYKLYGTKEHYRKTNCLNDKTITAVLYTTARFSEGAKEAASALDVVLKKMKLDVTYPSIKCNVSQSGEKIYHLPSDPFYDKIKINRHNGDAFVHTAAEAKSLGFRRAKSLPKDAA